MSALKAKILARIAAEGPLTVAQYMEMALGDPQHGYYMKRDPFGARGDFITAPEVSQMFGELIGLWFVQAWEDHGAPKRFHFVELGPGRATLMADMLRAAKVRPEFLQAAHITLIETSPTLRKIQKQALQAFAVEWAEDLNGISHDAPLFLVANEFFDALPIRQLVKTPAGWRERLVGANGNRLVFTQSKAQANADVLPEAQRILSIKTICEFSESRTQYARRLGAHLLKTGGAALVVDYGHALAGAGDTLQAVRKHHYADPLAEPGEADLTAHVDFAALASGARAGGAKPFGPRTQAAFLEALGIRARAERLKANANAATRAQIDAAVDRLVGPSQMGTLFKVMAIASDGARAPAGFE